MMLNSCSSIYYLYQAGKGQLKLLNHGRPIEEVVKDETTDPALRDLLSKIPEVKHFGEKFGLRPTKNYQEYVKLDQDYVVYVVTVSDELKFKPQIFSFPIVGSFNYIGWVSERDAREFAQKYEKEGFDVDVRGASAYSTLGWFKDPLLSSMIPKTDGKVSLYAFPELVNIFIHESTHATVYLGHQSYFNESLASFVAEELTEKYFEEKGALKSEAYVEYRKNMKYGDEVRARFAKDYTALNAIYESAIPSSEKRVKKAAIIDKLRADLKIKRKITNAALIQFKTYHSSDSGFKELYVRKNKDMKVFLETLAKLKDQDFPAPQSEDFKAVIDRL